MIDYHCHILPQIDDGSRSVRMSLDMIRIMKSQGVQKIVATPHFYAHREQGVRPFLSKRKKAYQSIVAADPANEEIFLGAEVAIEHGVSRLPGIRDLELGNSGHILLELPYGPFSPWLLEEIQHIALESGLKPVIAHINRYLSYYSKSEIERVLQVDAVFQFNIEAFGVWKQRRFVKSLIRDGYPYIFGSDAHNLTSRKPNWDLLKAKAKPEIIAGAEVLV